MLMDGALYHYRIDAPDEWEQTKKKSLGTKGSISWGLRRDYNRELGEIRCICQLSEAATHI